MSSFNTIDVIIDFLSLNISYITIQWSNKFAIRQDS